jgi:DNA-binding beta-propeller fold protein YncE
VPDLAGVCLGAGAHQLVVFDRVRHQVVAVIPLGGAPGGLALDGRAARAFVSLPARDEVEVVDLAASRTIGLIRLAPGDRPGDLALTPDGRTLLAVNPGSRTVALLDPDGRMERGRVAVGERPSRVVVDRSGVRAYVIDSGSSRVAVVDVQRGAAAGAIVTDSEPVGIALGAPVGAVPGAGETLYAALRGLPYVTAFTVPEQRPVGRIYVGSSGAAVLPDPRTGRIYVAEAGQARLAVFEPTAFTPLAYVELPAPATELVIADAEDVLMALLPEAGAVAVVELTRGSVRSLFDVGDAPSRFAVTGARR